MIKGHLVNPLTKEWFEYDDRYRLWSCACKDGVSLCLTLDDCLLKEGELRELKRKIAQKRKELGLLQKI